MKLTNDSTRWTYSEVETALCLWEAVVDYRTAGYAKEKAGEDPGGTYVVLEEHFGNYGSFTMRAVVASMADVCNDAWTAMVELNGGDPPDDMIAFDFDFCPKFIADALENGLFEQAITWQHTRDDEIRAEAEHWTYPIAA